MKKVLSTLVAALVAVSFAGIVFAGPITPINSPVAAPAAPEMKKEENAPVKKAKKVKKDKNVKKLQKLEKGPITP